MMAADAIPDTYEMVVLSHRRVRHEGLRVIAEWDDDAGVIHVGWYAPEGSTPFLEAIYSQRTGILLQAPLF